METKTDSRVKCVYYWINSLIAGFKHGDESHCWISVSQFKRTVSSTIADSSEIGYLGTHGKVEPRPKSIPEALAKTCHGQSTKSYLESFPGPYHQPLCPRRTGLDIHNVGCCRCCSCTYFWLEGKVFLSLPMTYTLFPTSSAPRDHTSLPSISSLQPCSRRSMNVRALI